MTFSESTVEAAAQRYEGQGVSALGPTPEQWLALHHAFWRYCEVKPRQRLANEDVLAANDPLGHFNGYCVALGDGGVAYGLGVYPNDQGLLNYLTTMTLEDEPYGVEALERGLAPSAVLAPMTRALDPMTYVKDDAAY